MDFMNIAVHFTFQEEILKKVGHEAFELGLLKEREFDTREEDPTQNYSFYHLVLMEFLAAKFIATLDKVSFDHWFETLMKERNHMSIPKVKIVKNQ